MRRLAGNTARMITEQLFRIGARDWMGHRSALGAVGLCIGLWIRAKTVDQTNEVMQSAAHFSSASGHRRCG